MKRARLLLILALSITAAFGAIARASADTATSAALNGQEGDNKAATDQSGTSNSGDANNGQVVGAVSSGKTSVDATNSTDHADVSTGDARGENNASAFTGQDTSFISFVDNLRATDILTVFSVNLQEGDNKTDTVQLATTLSGDGIGGQVIGVVTSAGGSSDVTAANTSKNVDVQTGDARAFQASATFDGQDLAFFQGVGAFTDVLGVGLVANMQEGDNTTRDAQTISAASGDGVGGQVLGIVSSGAASVDAANRSEDVDLQSGDARAVNLIATFTGQNFSFVNVLLAQDVIANGPAGVNVQEGDNRSNASQDATAASGDVVGGEVAGIVTSAGGSADVVLANTSTSADASSVDSRFANSDETFVGQIASTFVSI